MTLTFDENGNGDIVSSNDVLEVPLWRDPERLVVLLFIEVTVLIGVVIVGLIYGVGSSRIGFDQVIEVQDCIAAELVNPPSERVICTLKPSE